jgi:hypothetical protein
MESINPKNQATVNRTINWLVKHNMYNDKRDQISDEFGEDCKQWEQINKKCEDTFEKFEENLSLLPLNQQKKIINSDLY